MAGKKNIRTVFLPKFQEISKNDINKLIFFSFKHVLLASSHNNWNFICDWLIENYCKVETILAISIRSFFEEIFNHPLIAEMKKELQQILVQKPGLLFSPLVIDQPIDFRTNKSFVSFLKEYFVFNLGQNKWNYLESLLERCHLIFYSVYQKNLENLEYLSSKKKGITQFSVAQISHAMAEKKNCYTIL